MFYRLLNRIQNSSFISLINPIPTTALQKLLLKCEQLANCGADYILLDPPHSYHMQMKYSSILQYYTGVRKTYTSAFLHHCNLKHFAILLNRSLIRVPCQ